MRPFVVYWNNIPAPYMVERFNALADRGNLRFEAWFNDRIHSDRSWNVDESSWRFRYRYMPTLVIGGRRLHFPLPLLKKSRPDVLVSLYAEPAFLFGWAMAKLRGIKTGFWVEVTFDRWVRRAACKEALKRWFFPRVDAIVTVGRDGGNFAMRYGAPQERIFYARHGIDVAHYSDGSTLARLERPLLREELGALGTTFIYGSFFGINVRPRVFETLFLRGFVKRTNFPAFMPLPMCLSFPPWEIPTGSWSMRPWPVSYRSSAQALPEKSVPVSNMG
jgi:hypothetical protein